MRGHIIKRYKDSYTIVLNLGIDTSTGKYRQQWIAVKGTKKEAEKKLADLLHQLDTGTFMKPGKTTLGEYLERWLKDYVWPNLAPRTAESYEHIMHKYVIPNLGQMVLTQLKPEHLQHFYSSEVSGGLSPQTIRHHHTCLHKALKMGVEWGLLSRNIADIVSPPRVRRPDMQIWEEEEVTRFLEVAKSTPYHALFYTALFTGMRRSEILALRWQNIDFILGQIYVSRSLHCLKGGKIIFSPTKTAKGRRAIALPPSAYMVLKKHRETQEANRGMLGIPLTDDDLVFCQLDGKPLLPNTVTHAWIKLVRRAGLKPIRLHDSRHTHASLMLKQGTSPKIVQERLGHATIAMTLDVYSHVVPGLQEAAAKRFDDAFTTKYNETEKEAVGKIH